MNEAPSPSVSEEIADIFRNYDIDSVAVLNHLYLGMYQQAYILHDVDVHKFRLYVSKL